MGRPRMIILIRHAQSEGNLNRDIHQIIPDHRVKLTQEGWKQANDAGYRLRELLRPDDTIRIFTSPYRRTRETTEGLLSSLTESSPESGPSPFSRSAIKVYEEPRLREQDFGNFQPCSAEMERMWQERADYGHFFYRIAAGESAADAYDRCAGFNESLWRSFSDDDFPSVCILVTHGLMTRVFLMKWYHWTVEYFEDLRNINHCEFVMMKRQDSGKYSLETSLRTWSELKRRATITARERRHSIAANQTQSSAQNSPSLPRRIWGGCIDGCKHDHSAYPRRTQIMNDATATTPDKHPSHFTHLPPSIAESLSSASIDIHAPEDAKSDPNSTSYHRSLNPSSPTHLRPGPTPIARSKRPGAITLPSRPSHDDLIHRGRDAGGSLSGLPTPLTEVSGDEDPETSRGDGAQLSGASSSRTSTRASTMRSARPGGTEKKGPTRRTTTEDVEGWMKESGMGMGKRADALGDPEEEEEAVDEDGEEETDNNGADELKRVEEAEKKDRSLRESVY